MESFKKWEPAGPIEWPCGFVEISTATPGLPLCLAFGADGSDRNLVLRFAWGQVIAFASWQEFAHPWIHEVVVEELPKLGGQYPTYTFPLLQVVDSKLVASLGDEWRLACPNIGHFRIVTLDHTVDIVAVGEPQVDW